MRKQKLLRLTATAILIATGLFAFEATPTASAYVRESCRMLSAQSSYGTTGSVTGGYATAVLNAGAYWTQTPTPLNIYKGGSSSQFSVDAYDFGNVGYTGVAEFDLGCRSGHWVNPYANWNTYYTDRYSTTAKTEVMVHEMGHILGLNHAGTSNCSGQPIMYANDNRYFVCGHVKPQTDDINGMNAIY